jgi:hypothetical protein
MSPENARAVRRARLARLLQEEPGLTRKEIAQRLGLKKDTLRRDLAALEEERAHSAGQSVQNAPAHGPADSEHAPAPAAPQVSNGSAPPAHEASADAAHTGDPDAQRAQPAQLPRREAGGQLVIDLSRRPGLLRDLAVLAQVGMSAQDLVETAMHVLAVGYRQGLAAGDVLPNRPFQVTRLSVASLGLPGPRVPPVRTAPPAPTAGRP